MLSRIPVNFAFYGPARRPLHSTVHDQSTGFLLIFLRGEYHYIDLWYKYTAQGYAGADDHTEAQEGLLNLSDNDKIIRTK